VSPSGPPRKDALSQAAALAPVIAGIRERAQVAVAAGRGAKLLFYLAGSIFDLDQAAEEARAANALLFVHIDLLAGIGKDAEGVRFLAEHIGVAGVLSTRSYLLKAAAEAGLLTVQRVFALDSEALQTAEKVIRATAPTAVEILPGLILPHIVHRLPFHELPPVIAGGLVETPAQVEALLASGAIAVSTSRPELWSWRPKSSV